MIYFVFRFLFFLSIICSSFFIGFCRTFCTFWLFGRIVKLSQSTIDRHIVCTDRIFRSNAKRAYFTTIFERYWRYWCWITWNYKMATLLFHRGNFCLFYKALIKWCDKQWNTVNWIGANYLICITTTTTIYNTIHSGIKSNDFKIKMGGQHVYTKVCISFSHATLWNVNSVLIPNRFILTIIVVLRLVTKSRSIASI